jgi:hypothetical protein
MGAVLKCACGISRSYCSVTTGMNSRPRALAAACDAQAHVRRTADHGGGHGHVGELVIFIAQDALGIDAELLETVIEQDPRSRPALPVDQAHIRRARSSMPLIALGLPAGTIKPWSRITRCTRRTGTSGKKRWM